MKHLFVAMLFLASPHVAAAGELTDLIMAPGLFAQAEGQGEILRYAHSRQLPEAAEGAELPGADKGIALPRPIAEGQVVLSRVDDDRLTLSLADQETPDHVVADFPASGPNPILLMFLEDVVRTMTAQTGGSPYYIRNRIRDSLVGSGQGEAQGELMVTRLQPFLDDPNRQRMGDFADLALTIAYDPSQPARLVELVAMTGTGQGGYTERMILEE